MPASELRPVALTELRAAKARLAALAATTPLVRCGAAGSNHEIFLKLENLQPVGSFKIRPIGSAVLAKPRSELAGGIYTCSSGNSAIAVAWMARRLAIPAAAVVTEDAPEGKLALLRALKARIVPLPFDAWWEAIETAGCPGQPGTYIDAVRDPAALAGNAALGAEILEQLPEVEAIFTPFGGGSLACGIASAVRQLKPSVKVIACELETAAPLTAALRAGRVVSSASDPGFVTGVGFHSLLPEMWPLCRDLIDGTLTVSLQEAVEAIRLLAGSNRVIAEGAGAIPVAAALSDRHPYSRICAVVSGGNLGSDVLSIILAGGMPP